MSNLAAPQPPSEASEPSANSLFPKRLGFPFEGRSLFSERRILRFMWILVGIGLLARGVRFFLCFPLWEDETFLCLNLVDRTFWELTQPLDCHQVAPLCFLWIQRASVMLFGFSEWSLRLYPFLAGIGSLLLFVHLCRRFLKGTALLLAVGIFAVSYAGIRYAAEAKPYGSDLFVSMLLLTFAVEWWHQPRKTRWLWALVAFVPVAIFLSYPSVFMAGGVSLLLGYLLWQQRGTLGQWSAWVAYNGLLVGAFGTLFLLATRHQTGAELDWMQVYWKHTFPPLDQPGQLVVWFVVTHFSDLVAYPVGGERGASFVTGFCFLVGLVTLARRRQFPVLLMVLAPLGLNLIAASLQRYPYGGHVRFGLYAAPVICMMAGLGMAGCLQGLLAFWRKEAKKPKKNLLTENEQAAWVKQRGRRWAIGTCVVLSLIATVSIVRDISHPFKTRADYQARSFAQWFWSNSQYEAETVCIKSDLDLDFSPDAYEQLSWATMFRCNMHIYSPRHHELEPFAWEKVTSERPLRVLVYRAGGFDFDEAGLNKWLEEMQSDLQLVSKERFPFTRYNKRETELINVDHVDIYRFARLPEAAPSYESNPVNQQETAPMVSLPDATQQK
ncbi:Hypothetical protein PBC10988_22180 [Planctomycetales bacterium 10988]|nr:Hypothetical protein PBC10988_22180 [Planctomycetales bacterium 10988]